MNKYNSDILKVVDILVALQNEQDFIIAAQKQDINPNLLVKRSFLKDSGINPFEFCWAFQKLHERGYVFQGQVFFDQNRLSEGFEEVKKKAGMLDEEVNTAFNNPEFIQKTKDKFLELAPQHQKHTLVKELNDEDGEKIPDAMEVIDMLQQEKDLFASITIYPLRSLKRVQDILREEIHFKDIVDEGLSYNPKTYILYLNELQISTKERNEAAGIHYVLQQLFMDDCAEQIDYVDIPEFDKNEALEKELEKWKEACRTFQKKVVRAKNDYGDFLIIKSKYVQINPRYLEQD